MHKITTIQTTIIFTLILSLLSACSGLPTSGFGRKEVEKKTEQPNMQGIQVIDVTDAIAQKLYKKQSNQVFSEAFGSEATNNLLIGLGDTLEISIWEAPPATLFGGTDKSMAFAPSKITLPEQTVSADGNIVVPFAGQIKASGRTLSQIEKDITNKLKGKANQPQIIAKLIRNQTSNVTVVGEFASNVRMPLSPRGERLLDAIAAAGGVKQPINKMTVQISRDDAVHAMPLETIIKDPKQNIALKSGDVITALFQPNSFTALGATGKNEEINFEAQGISLAQALARTGGLVDTRADAQGVFLFRFEPADAMEWPQQPVAKTADGKVPVIYRINLKDPSSFFVAQSFQMSNKDVLYISNAPITELQKFLNVLFSITFPLLNATTVLSQ